MEKVNGSKTLLSLEISALSVVSPGIFQRKCHNDSEGFFFLFLKSQAELAILLERKAIVK